MSTDLEHPDAPPEDVLGAEPRGDEGDLDQEMAGLAVDDGKGNKMVPLSALIGAKREAKTLGKRVKELEPIAARVQDVNGRLDRAEPVIAAILSNPKLKAEAIRLAGGTVTSRETTLQPDAAEDPDAAAFAEDSGFYLADGATLDTARARRVLDRLDARHGRQTDERIRPLAGLTLNEKANRNLEDAMRQTDDLGVPLATQESIRDVAGMMPAHLLANPAVVELVINTAIGVDHRKGRTPKPQDDPLVLDSAGGRGRRPEAITADERRLLTKVGLTEKEYAETAGRLAHTTPGRGVRLE